MTSTPEALVGAARIAVSRLPEASSHRAQAAERGVSASQALGDPASLASFRSDAFYAEPRLGQLFDLVQALAGHDDWRAVLREAGAHAGRVGQRELDGLDEDEACDGWLAADARVEALTLGMVGDWVAAHSLAERHPLLGWSSDENPQAITLALTLVAIAGGDPRRLPVAVSWLWQLHAGPGPFDRRFEDDADDERFIECRDAAVAEALSHQSLSADQQHALLQWCTDIARRRLEAIAQKRFRKAYHRAAAALVACAEAAQACDAMDVIAGTITGIRRQFPRHSALHAELAEWEGLAGWRGSAMTPTGRR